MAALCYNTAMKFQCVNGLSYTHNEFILNALLECVYTCIYKLYFKLPKMFYPSQLFINSMFVFLLQELDLLQYIYYIISHALSTPKHNF